MLLFLVPELGEPKNKLRLIPPSEMAAHSFPLAVESARRAYARAHADGLSLSASCGVSWSTTCGESKLRELLKARPSSRNRSG